jgi:beta-lactamase superfamily II metal-dependent hydrolase
MASLTRVMILYCGQGMTTMVEVYDDGVVKDTADYLALVDCGGSSEGADEAVGYVAHKILAAHGTKLDLLVISHQDGDHHSFLSKLQEKLKGFSATCDAVVIGGTGWSAANRKSVKKFIESMEMDTNDVEFDAPKRSDYKTASQRSELKFIDAYGDTYIRVLISGLPITGTPDMKKNGSSAMVVVENGSYSVFLPGDATHQTMDAATDIIDAKKLLIPHVVGVEIPHHGALRTSVENYYAGGKIDRFNWDRINAFAGALSADRVVASAGLNNKFHHPLDEVIAVFWPWLVQIDDHGYRAYVFEKGGKGKGSTPEGWNNFTTTSAADCTIRSYNETAGTYRYGDIAIRLSKPGVFTPEEMIEFIPRGQARVGTGADGMETVEDLVVYAPAPPQSPAPVT